MRGRPQSFSTDLMLSAIADSRTVEEAAQKTGCTAALIHTRARDEYPIRQAIQSQRDGRESEIAESILEHRGVLSKVAESLDLGSAQAVRYHITKSPKLQRVYEDARDRIVDLAQDNVFEAVEKGDLTYSWKLLQTIGKDLGYSEKRIIDSTVTHTLGDADNGSLKEMLNRLAETHPDAVEAEFEVLSPEDRALLGKALSSAEEEPVSE